MTTGNWSSQVSLSKLCLAVATLLLGAIIVATLASSRSATAQQLNQNFVVDSTADTVDATPGDNTCADSGGDCTLRAAIMEANALIGQDTVTLPAGTYTLSIAGTGEDVSATGDLDVTSNLTINGAGESTTIIDGGDLDRVFHVHAAVSLTASDITIQNGSTPGNIGGGIRSAGALALDNTTVKDNVSTGSPGGGGIYNTGLVIMTNSTLSGNDANFSGGGIYNTSSGTVSVSNSEISANNSFFGGGIYNNQGSLTLTNVDFIGNTTDSGSDGAGIYNSSSSTFNVSNVSFTGNTASRHGGGIFINGSAATNSVLTDTTFEGNTASTSGGGIYNNGGTTILDGSTVSFNFALSGPGGGIRNVGNTADLTIINSTISGNNASGNGGGVNNESASSDLRIVSSTINENTGIGGVGGVNVAAGTVTLKNTIIANSNFSSDCGGTITSAGHNLDTDNTCSLTGTGDIPNGDPKLGPLQNNGGPTFTHSLLTSSDAVDAVPPADCLDQNGSPLTVDQRDVVRPQGVNCDIGSYETQIIDVFCNGLQATIVGSDGPDVINGTSGDDVIAGLAGNDIINGLAGNDTICGGDGKDTINGGDGNDVILGQKQKDFIFGDAGDDNLNGNSGGDRIEGGDGEDTIDGGSSRDRLFGNKQNDTLFGDIGNDVLKGGRGHDDLFGEVGNDKLRGQDGNDNLDCGTGDDIADGGGGTDTATPDCEAVSNVP